MNTEQERAAFESWRRKHYDYDDLDAFEIEFAFDAYKAGRAFVVEVVEELRHAYRTAMEQTIKARIPERAEFAGIAQDLGFVLDALEQEDCND